LLDSLLQENLAQIYKLKIYQNSGKSSKLWIEKGKWGRDVKDDWYIDRVIT